MKSCIRKLNYVWISLIVLLVIARLALPYCLLPLVEHKINQIPQYRAKIADLDVHLYRGAYTLKEVQLWKISGKKLPVPFFAARRMDFSLEWKALLHGRVVAKIVVTQPILNFVTDPNGKNEQLTISRQWLDIVKSLFPLNINRLEVHDGKISLISYKGNPPFKIDMHDTELTIDNMQKATAKNNFLSSAFSFNAHPGGGGTLDVNGKYDPFAKKPLFDMKIRLVGLKVAKIKPFLRHYTSVDVVGGIFSLYGEAAATRGKIKGYVKPFFKNLKIGQPHDGPLNALADGVAKLATEVLKNADQKTIATRINIDGNVDDPDTSVLSIIGYLLRHAFIQALLPGIDDTIKPQDILYQKKGNTETPLFTG